MGLFNITYETDVLILGGGASGLAAAAAAAERGAKVIIAEAGEAVGGNGLFPRGVFAVNSRIQRKKLVFADTDVMFRQAMDYSHWKIDGRIIRALLEKSGETIDWLMDKGVEFTDVVHHLPNQMPEVFHITSAEENVGKQVVRCLKNFCLRHGAEIFTGVSGKELMKNDNGEICGAVCETCEGNIFIFAKKVIVATGGFSGNEEMIRKYYPDFKPEGILRGKGMKHNGDGIRMALEAGADIEGHFAMEIEAPKIDGYPALGLLMGRPYNVWVNKQGRRFADEGIVYNFPQAANACMRQPGGEVYVMFNDQILQTAVTEGPDIIGKIHMPLDVMDRLPDDIQAAVADEKMIRAENLVEAAKFIGCDVNQLAATVAEYNEACASGRDAVFAKERRNMIPLGDGPFIIIKGGTRLLITHGGIRVNECFQALDAKHEKLNNLYVTGVDFGGADADIYNVVMSGHGFGFALNSGRIAGEKAVEEIVMMQSAYF